MKKGHPDIETMIKANAATKKDYDINFGGLSFNLFPRLERSDRIQEGEKYIFIYVIDEFSDIKTVEKVSETHVYTICKYGFNQKISIEEIDAIFEVKSMDRFLMAPDPATLN